MDFTFATILYKSNPTVATADKLIADWSQAYQGVDYITVDSFRLKITH